MWGGGSAGAPNDPLPPASPGVTKQRPAPNARQAHDTTTRKTMDTASLVNPMTVQQRTTARTSSGTQRRQTRTKNTTTRTQTAHPRSRPLWQIHEQYCRLAVACDGRPRKRREPAESPCQDQGFENPPQLNLLHIESNAQ